MIKLYCIQKKKQLDSLTRMAVIPNQLVKSFIISLRHYVPRDWLI